MTLVRLNTFETNSSSCHAIATLNKRQLEDLKTLDFVIWFNDPKNALNDFKILPFEDAYAKYCMDVKSFNESLENDRQSFKEIEYNNFASFKDDIIDGINPHSDITGYYLTFNQLMTFIDLDKLDKNKITFNVTWENNN